MAGEIANFANSRRTPLGEETLDGSGSMYIYPIDAPISSNRVISPTAPPLGEIMQPNRNHSNGRQKRLEARVLRFEAPSEITGLLAETARGTLLRMTPQQFIANWQAAELKERAACQEHFLNVCELLGQPTAAAVSSRLPARA